MKYLAALVLLASPALAGTVALDFDAIPASNGADSYCVYWSDTQGTYMDPARWGAVEVPTTACVDSDGDGTATCSVSILTLPDLTDPDGAPLRNRFFVVRARNDQGESAPSNEIVAPVMPPMSPDDLRQQPIRIYYTDPGGQLREGELVLVGVTIPEQTP